ncbi:hypothetical protein G6F32_016177 [Rhizopus arrhizus]|nr:hypothetical protein G6F32_016177 [Rhizopus arrhizus]
MFGKHHVDAKRERAAHRTDVQAAPCEIQRRQRVHDGQAQPLAHERAHGHRRGRLHDGSPQHPRLGKSFVDLDPVRVAGRQTDEGVPFEIRQIDRRLCQQRVPVGQHTHLVHLQ